MSMMEAAVAKILLLQGANLTYLGRREPEIYGSTTPADLNAMLQGHAHDHGYHLEIFYTNIEGEAPTVSIRQPTKASTGWS